MTKCFLLHVVVLSIVLGTTHVSPAADVRVMTFNLWVGGDAGGQRLERSIEAIRVAKADIVGFQETSGQEVEGVRPDNGAKIAKMMGWHYLNQGDGTGILSRFPIISSTPGRWGAKIEYASGRELAFFNVHFFHAPYQPYQLLDIPYADAPFLETEAEAIAAAEQARGKEVTRLLEDLGPVLDLSIPVILTGDFNEPSHQDWTERGVAAGTCPLKVEYPATRRITAAGMTDAWRKIYPDEVSDPGPTWTPTTSPTDRSDRHDRIDYIFVNQGGVSLTAAERVGEEGVSELFIDSWPSDHRAVVVTLSLD